MPNSDRSSFPRLVEVMARLRREGGCPWDRQQTHETLKAYLIEEAYEVLEDDKKKQMYDTYGHAGVDENVGVNHGNPFSGFGFGNGNVHVQWGGDMSGGDAQSIFDFFEQAYGGQESK